ncbi:MAG: hypothetical protein JW881_21480 [Spirochaetales bacterium]|nr:hypothetical protein [Spirochaetales bacterium]
MNQDQVKEKLLLLDEATEDFRVIFSGKKSRKVDGLYLPDTREIIIHNKNHETDGELMYTAIHEFAHHIHFTTSSVPVSTKAHTVRFWNILHTLLFKAEESGIYRNIFTANPEFVALTKTIKEEFLYKNGLLMKEFGGLLARARELCDKYHASFTDYIDRILSLPRTNARSCIKVHAYNIDPRIGFENMKTVAGIASEEIRAKAERAFLDGQSPDMVKVQWKSREEHDDPLINLKKEKMQIEKRITLLSQRLKEVVKRINEWDNG